MSSRDPFDPIEPPEPPDPSDPSEPSGPSGLADLPPPQWSPAEPAAGAPDLANLPPPRWPAETPGVAPGSYLPESNWNLGHILLVLATGIIFAPFLAVVAIGIAGGVEAIDDTSPLVLLTIQGAASLSAVALISRLRGTGSWRRDFGFRLEPRHVWGIAAGMVLQVVVALLTLPLVQWFAPDEGPQQEVARIAEDLSGWELAGFGLIVAVLTPVFEEIVFRGMLLGRLVKVTTARRAVLISSAAFAATHLLDPNAYLVVPGLFIVGVVLGYLALRTGNIGLPIFVHMGTNGLAVLLLAYADELEQLQEDLETALALLF